MENAGKMDYEEFIDFFKWRNENFPNRVGKIHKHHILPKHAGGSSDGETVVLNTVEHSIVHYLRYLKYGQTKDLTAYHMLSGNFESLSQYAGRQAAKVCRKNKKNSFFDPILHKKAASKGGKVTGAKNVKSGHLLRISQDPILKAQRSEKLRGRIWVNNGTISMLVHKDVIPEFFVIGRLKLKK